MQGQVIEIELTAMGHGGEAIGRHEGKVIFAAGGIPGEVVRAEIVEDEGRYARGFVREVISPSPDRRAPACAASDQCGGCDWQHIDYERQLALKVEVLRGQLGRQGLEPPTPEPIGMEVPWHYRNHARLLPGPGGKLSFREAGSHRPVPAGECRLLHPILLDLMEDIEADFPGLLEVELRAGTNTGEALVVLWLEGDEAPAVELEAAVSVVAASQEGGELLVAGDPFYHEEMWGRRFRVSYGSFFQVNTLQAEAMAEVIAAYLDPRPGDSLLDAYCGVGTFGLLVAGEVSRLVGVDENPMAVEDARENGVDVPHARFVEGSPSEAIAELADAPCTLAILDPPRAGCDREDLEALMGMAPRRIVYASCDPATLARDLKRLAEGGYRVEEVQVVDMFPQTSHVESVSLLVRG